LEGLLKALPARLFWLIKALSTVDVGHPPVAKFKQMASDKYASSRVISTNIVQFRAPTANRDNRDALITQSEKMI
jgi:hypothetical protein